MADQSASDPEWSVPTGAPIRVYQWLVPPFLLVALAGFEIFTAMVTDTPLMSSFSVIAAVVLVAAAIGLWIYGYRAYRDLTQRAVERYVAVGVISLVVTGVVLSFGVLALLPLVWAGYLSGTRPYPLFSRVRARLQGRLWLRTAAIAAVVTVVCVLLQPLAVGLDSLPLIVLVTIGRIVAPFVFGFALRVRAGGAVVPNRER